MDTFPKNEYFLSIMVKKKKKKKNGGLAGPGKPLKILQKQKNYI